MSELPIRRRTLPLPLPIKGGGLLLLRLLCRRELFGFLVVLACKLVIAEATLNVAHMTMSALVLVVELDRRGERFGRSLLVAKLLIGHAAFVVVLGVGRLESDRIVEFDDRFLVVAGHHVRECAVVIGRRVAIAGGNRFAVGLECVVVLAELGVRETSPQTRARVVGQMSGRLEIGDRHLVFTNQVEADSAAK